MTTTTSGEVMTKLFDSVTDRKDMVGKRHSSSTLIHEGDEEWSLSITFNIRKLIEGKIDERGKVSFSPQANSQS